MNNYSLWKRYYKKNIHYHADIQEFTKHVIPPRASVLEIGAKGGELLSALPNKNSIGVVFDEYKGSTRKNLIDLKKLKRLKKKYDYILVNHVFSHIDNIQDFVSSLKKNMHNDTKVIVLHFNYFWKPILDVLESMELILPYKSEPNWLSSLQIENIFNLEGFEKIKNGNRFLLPLNIKPVSVYVNKYLSPLPLLNRLCLTGYSIFKLNEKRKEKSVSIIIPARNEAGHMNGVVKKIPIFSKNQEIIFVEGHSTDDTYEVIEQEIKKNKGPMRLRLFKQKGKGKGDAVRLGFEKAKGEMLMILDADLTVDPKDLPKFYNAIVENKADFVMGSRLVYPMEKLAMRSLNILGNHFFSVVFSFLLDQKITDTLCGTKVLLKRDYEKIAKNRKFFGDFDPFGDFDLIFGAAKLNMKIIEIPIRYKERVYGTTNISRFTHGWLLLKMVTFAAKKIKFV